MSTPFWQELPPGFHQRRCLIDDDLGFEVFIWRGQDADCKVLLLNGATHGDEWEGPTFLTELAQTLRPNELNGTVVAVPVLNEAAFFACQRCSPLDEKNLARVFPGNPHGTPSEKLAHVWQSRFVMHATYYVDIHSAGAAYEILPWVGYVMHNDARVLQMQRQMCACFQRLWHWGTPYLPGRTISAAAEHNVPAIYFEFRGKGGCEEVDLDILRLGFPNLLRTLGFASGDIQQLAPLSLRESTANEEGHLQTENPSPCDGILTHIVELGTQVAPSESIATVQPLDGSTPCEVRSKTGGRVVMSRRFRAVRQGEALAVIVDVDIS